MTQAREPWHVSSEDIRTEYPQAEHIAFSSSKLTLCSATPVSKAHGTITPGGKGGADPAESHHSSPTDSLTCMSYSTLLHPHGCTWNTPGELHRNQEFLFLSARRLHLFQHRSTEVSHSLTGGMLSSASFSSPGSTVVPTSCWFPPKTLPWPHLCGSRVRLTSQSNYPIEQQRKSWEEFALLLKPSFHSQSSQVCLLI